MNQETVSKIVREVLQEMGLLNRPSKKQETRRSRSERTAPVVLNVFHPGVRKLEQALEQVSRIEDAAAKSSIFTVDSARPWVCGADVKKKSGSRCILDTVKPDGIEKVLQRADILILPTFCFKTASKVSRLIGDDQESAIVLSALFQNKPVLAANDGFILLNTLANHRIREEMQRILDKLEAFGMVFCQTEQLAATFEKMMTGSGNPVMSEAIQNPGSPSKPAATLITAKDIRRAVDAKVDSVLLAAGGIVTPLAQDQAKEYGVTIVRQHS